MGEMAWLGLGANVGDALETLSAAVFAIDDVDGIAVDEVSGVYRTAPWPPPGEPGHVPQDDYLNLALRAVTTLEPLALLDELLLIEDVFGRDRRAEVRWGPRVLDVDMLLYGDRVIDHPRLTVPHPRIAERGFVLVPLLEVAPGASLPDGRKITALLNELAPITGVEHVLRLEDVPTHHLHRPAGPGAPSATFSRPSFDTDSEGG